jgi:hypothetical protein
VLVFFEERLRAATLTEFRRAGGLWLKRYVARVADGEVIVLAFREPDYAGGFLTHLEVQIRRPGRPRRVRAAELIAAVSLFPMLELDDAPSLSQYVEQLREVQRG